MPIEIITRDGVSITDNSNYGGHHNNNGMEFKIEKKDKKDES